jgi:hypothetical protein
VFHDEGVAVCAEIDVVHLTGSVFARLGLDEISQHGFIDYRTAVRASHDGDVVRARNGLRRLVT